MILRATIRPEPDDGRRDELRVEATDYAAALGQIATLTPDGWIRLHLITGDPEPTEVS